MSVDIQTVGVRELRGKLSEYLRRTRSGESFDVVMRGTKIAELRAPPLDENFRKPGALKGKMRIADDFDTWPEGFLDQIEAGDIFPK